MAIAMAMRTYKLRPDGFARIRLRLVVMMAVMFCVINLLIIGYETFLEKSPVSWNIELPMLLFLFLVFVVVSAREIRRQRAKWLSYRLSVGEARVVREQVGLKPLEITFAEITKMRETRGGGLSIMGRDKFTMIFVPESLEGYDEVRAAFADIGDVEQASVNARLRIALSIGAIIVLVPIYPLVMSSHDPRTVAPLGVALFVFFLWAFAMTQRHKGVDKRIKRGSWLWLVFLAALAWKIVTTLRG